MESLIYLISVFVSVLIILLVVLLVMLHQLTSAVNKYFGFFIESQAEQNTNHFRLSERVRVLEERLNKLETKEDSDGKV